jgi:tRNAThr (cytosine32-N3)-methyltransferase
VRNRHLGDHRPPKKLTFSWLSSLPRLFAADELALLFTGSPAPPTAHEHAQLQQQAQECASESTEVEADEENGDDEDERLPDGQLVSSSAAIPIPPNLDSDSSSSAAAPSGPLPSSSSSDPSPHVIHPSLQGGPDVLGLAHPLFTIMQLGVDRRLLVNRKRQLKMYRVWMQGKFQRTEVDGAPLVVDLNAGTS